MAQGVRLRNGSIDIGNDELIFVVEQVEVALDEGFAFLEVDLHLVLVGLEERSEISKLLSRRGQCLPPLRDLRFLLLIASGLDGGGLLRNHLRYDAQPLWLWLHLTRF